jgi:agmatine/peptidylarginine deiminase
VLPLVGLSLALSVSASPRSEVVLVGSEVVHGTMVGDWEPPDAVAIVFTQTWLEAWRQMLDALTRSTNVLVMREDIASARAMQREIDALPPAQQDRVWRTGIFVDSPWVRDWGPLQMRDGGVPRWLDAPYAEARPWDDMAPRVMAEFMSADVFAIEASIDGGALASNGEGLCVSTLEYFDAYVGDPTGLDLAGLGCHVLALVPALRDEPTMHIDLLLQFVEPGVVALAEIDQEQDPDNAMRLSTAAATLKDAAATMRRPLSIERVPMPAPRGELFRSYTNFFRTADSVLIPSYDRVDEALEDAAHDVLQSIMPEARFVPIPSERMTAEGGAIHCLTLGLHLPAGG